MLKLVSNPFVNNNDEQVLSQGLEILNVLDLDLMFKDNPGNQINEQLESDELDNFIQELDKEDDFDPILLVQNFNN